MPQSFAEELRSIPMSSNLGQSLERAHRFAREQQHRLVTLEHLLLALTEDPEAGLILQSANIDLGRLGTDVSGYLGRLLEDMRANGAVEPRPDSELLRVLQAAASAAQQSKRRQIDGAIVLAAIVGDGKSPAAGLLKALGMTFEEAIRALQRANTKARLKPSNPASAETSKAPTTAPASPDPAPASATDATSSSPQPGATPAQSAEEILAAARARIQQRSATAAAQSGPARASDPSAPLKSTEAAAPADAQPAGEPADATEKKLLTDAIEAAMAASAARVAQPQKAPPSSPEPPPDVPPSPISPPAGGRPARSTWAPPPEQHPPQPPPTPTQARIPQPPAASTPRGPVPFPARPLRPGEGPRRPPLPQQAPAPQPQTGFPNRPARAPWPEPGERGGAIRPPLANGHGGSVHPSPPPGDRPTGAPGGARASRRGGGQAEKGPLIEQVPRRMRVGVPGAAEVRIARDRIEALIVTLNGAGSAPVRDASVMRALSVRLRSPDGSFWIEPATPETQWVESASNLIHDDYAVWRWTVVPRRRGRAQLALVVSARTIGRDGIAAETAPPDRVIEVRVRANRRRAIMRWTGLIAALLAGAMLGRFIEPIWFLASMAIRKGLGV